MSLTLKAQLTSLLILSLLCLLSNQTSIPNKSPPKSLQPTVEDLIIEKDIVEDLVSVAAEHKREMSKQKQASEMTYLVELQKKPRLHLRPPVNIHYQLQGSTNTTRKSANLNKVKQEEHKGNKQQEGHREIELIDVIGLENQDPNKINLYKIEHILYLMFLLSIALLVSYGGFVSIKALGEEPKKAPVKQEDESSLIWQSLCVYFNTHPLKGH